MSIFSKNNNQQSSKAPDDTVIYAVGDIHGRADLIKKMHRMISEDAQKYTVSRKIIVYIGDYIDRGHQSKDVLNELINNVPQGFEPQFLLGNHEYAIAQFLQSPKTSMNWLSWGGDATLYSYNVDMSKRDDAVAIHKSLKKNIPKDHLQFIKQLKTHHIEGDYFFVHAGLRPDIELHKQHITDMLMIRDEFIYSKYDFGKVIVFGHTIFDEPFIADGRLGIDTGAYASGCLTAAIFYKDKISFIDTLQAS